MAVRNQMKAAVAANGKVPPGFPTRKVFVGDPAAWGAPELNPAPTTARGKRRIQNGKATAKTPPQIVVGLGHRPHCDSRGYGSQSPRIGGHSANPTYTRLVTIKHGRRIYGRGE